MISLRARSCLVEVRSIAVSRSRPETGGLGGISGFGGRRGAYGCSVSDGDGDESDWSGWGGAKKKLCMKLGFTKVKDVAEEVMRITDEKGAHGVFVKARGNAAYEAAPKMVRVVGRVMCVGLRK